MLLLLLLPMVGQAAARIIVPDGWAFREGAVPEAQRRAGDWREALGIPLTEVASSTYDDRFAETVAVFERPAPVSVSDFEDEAAGFGLLAQIMHPIVGAEEARETAIRPIQTGEAVIWSRWVVDSISYDCILAPSGQTSTVVIMAVRADSLADYRDTYERIALGLEGVTSPMPHFSLWAWRGGSILVWLCLALGLHALMLRYVDHDSDHATAGSRAAGLELPFVIIAGGLTYFGLSGRALGIEYAGSSLAAVAAWVGVSGMCVSGLHFLLATRLDRGMVRSAPSSGVFASGSYASNSATFLSSSISRTSMRAEEIAAASGTWASSSQLGRREDFDLPSPEDLAASSAILPKLTAEHAQGEVEPSASEALE